MAELAQLIPFPGRRPLSEAEERAVKAILSRFIGSRRTAQSISQFIRILRSYADPFISGPPDDTRGWASFETTMRKLGIDSDVISNQWRLAKQEGTHLLPDETIDAIVPRILWPVVWQFCCDGPAGSWDRCDRIFNAWSLGLELDGSPRAQAPNALAEDGRITDRTLGLHIGCVVSFWKCLDKLRREQVFPRKIFQPGDEIAHALGCWTASDFPDVPEASSYDAPALRITQHTPSARLVRLALVVLNEQIVARSRTKKGRMSMFRVLRARAVLATLAILGCREKALRQIRRSDLLESHTFDDGTCSPAIVLRPAKSMHKTEVRIKAIPPVLHGWLIEYADYLGLQAKDPLFVSTRAKAPMSKGCLAGVLVYALRVPRSPATGTERALAEAWAPFKGVRFTPHSFRRLAERLAYNIGEEYRNLRVPGAIRDGTIDQLPPAQAFADTLLDHAMGSMGDLYKGLKTPEGRARWAKEAALGIGRLLLEVDGARRGPNIQRIRAARHIQIELGHERASLLARLDKINRRSTASIPVDAIPQEELLRLVASQQAASLEASVVGAQLAEIADRINAANLELVEALAEEVPVGDDLTDAELEAVRREAHSMEGIVVDIPSDPELPEVRNWVTGRELYEAIGAGYIGESTVRRWLTGNQHYPEGDPRNMFEMDAVDAVSDRRRRVLLDRLDVMRLAPEIRERLEAMRYLPPPDGWERIAAADPSDRSGSVNGSAFTCTE